MYNLLKTIAFTICTVVIFSNVTVSATEINMEIDYYAQMVATVKNAGEGYLQKGRNLELKRNRKIELLNLEDIYQTTNLFDGSKDIHEIRKNMGMAAYDYTPSDLDLLARLIMAEAGCDWIPDWVQRAVGSVTLNHVDSPRFPNTLKGVVYRPWAYSCVPNGLINRKATQKCINNARYILENGVTIPKGVLGQGPKMGKVYTSYYDPLLRTTIWFCYI